MYEGKAQDGKRYVCVCIYTHTHMYTFTRTHTHKHTHTHIHSHGLGVYTWKQGDSYSGMWFMGLPHGLGVAEYASEAAVSHSLSFWLKKIGQNLSEECVVCVLLLHDLAYASQAAVIIYLFL
jgi:hypothetical protein